MNVSQVETTRRFSTITPRCTGYFDRGPFATMAGAIDPPSSLTRLPRRSARPGGQGRLVRHPPPRHPVACAVWRRQGNAILLGQASPSPRGKQRGASPALLVEGCRTQRAHSSAGAWSLQEKGAKKKPPPGPVVCKTGSGEPHRPPAFTRLGFPPELPPTAHPGYERPTSLTFAHAAVDGWS